MEKGYLIGKKRIERKLNSREDLVDLQFPAPVSLRLKFPGKQIGFTWLSRMQIKNHGTLWHIS